MSVMMDMQRSSGLGFPIAPENAAAGIGNLASAEQGTGVRFVPPSGIGDLASTEKGTGARYNSGKPDLSLIPLDLLAWNLDCGDADGFKVDHGPLAALDRLGYYQRTHDVTFLYDAIARLAVVEGEAGVSLDELAKCWEECAAAFAYGKKKYAAWNWAKGMPWSVPIACAARHLVAMIREEAIDPESGLPHRGHVMCNLVMLLQYAKTYPAGNDLPPKGLL